MQAVGRERTIARHGVEMVLAGAAVLASIACSDGHAVPDAEESHDRKADDRDAGGRDAGDRDADGRIADVDPLRRYEPDERVDFDNVVAYGDDTGSLELPEPPKSGFRVIVPPRKLAPGEEIEACHAFAYPPQLTHANVYAVRLYTTGGLHHSNLYGMPLSLFGASPYPACAAGQGLVTAQIPNLLAGDIMDVLFANSTLITGANSSCSHRAWRSSSRPKDANSRPTCTG